MLFLHTVYPGVQLYFYNMFIRFRFDAEPVFYAVFFAVIKGDGMDNAFFVLI